MLGLFGTLNLGSRSLQTQQQAVEVAGQNLANVNNPAYTRQRVDLQTSLPLPTTIGPEGTGVQAVAIRRLRDVLLDSQIQGETSISGFLDAQQKGLQYAEAAIGEQLASTSSTSSVGSSGGLANNLTNLFNAFQDLSTNPASLTLRQTAISDAQQLTTQFNQLDQRLDTVNTNLNQSVQTDVNSANQLLTDIAKLNYEIVGSERSGTANDLRDIRQQKIEELAKLTNVQTAEDASGNVNISVGGQLLVSGYTVQDTLQTYDAGGGQLQVRTATGGTPLTLTGGSIAGTIDVRDGALQSLRDGVNTLASTLISQINTVYRTGYGLNGTTGADLFTGTDAGSIGVNSALANDPASFQASGVSGASGNNQVVLALAQMANTRQPGLNNQTFTESYSGTITDLGNALASVNSQVDEQDAVALMLQTQRSAVSGVSIDEEMTDLVKFQRAYQASAHLVNVVNDMLGIVVNLGS